LLNKNKRVLWLLNHKTLMPYEAKLLVELGYEVFTPKVIPSSPSFRSGAVTFEYDSTLTIPRRALKRLNEFNFYETEWPADIVALMNRYFGTVYVIPHGVQTKEAVKKFEGQIMFRAFGLDNSQTYVNVLEILYGTEILADIAALGDRFRFAQGYDQLVECEPPLISDRAVFLPIGVPSSFWDTANSYTGVDKRILFVCPNCVTNPYYAAIYKKFKEDFGDLPHAIFGAQDVPVDDPHLLGFVTDEELIRLYRDSAVLYYHSTELRHVHYSPIEATINGMPLIYFADSLLGRMTPEITMGRCETPEEARRSIERILAGDAEYVDAVRSQQRALAFKFSDEYCRSVWKLNLSESGYEAALAPESRQAVYWRELKRSVLKPFAHGLSKLPARGKAAMPPVAQLATADTDDSDQSTIKDGIDFTRARYPSFVRSVTGINAAEPWGRWSDAAKISISFAQPLPKKFRLVIEGCAYGPNVGAATTVKVGNVKRAISFMAAHGSPEKIVIDFSTWKRASMIQINVPHPVIPPNDNRQIGLGFVRLSIDTLVADV
jgi:hypothetical protein